MNLGDIVAGQIIYFHFTTRQFSTGAPLTSASLAISCYKNDSTTQTTTGITTTFTTGFDGVAGLVSVKIDTSADGTFYAAGSDVSVVVTAGTVDSVSIVGEVVGYFSIANRSALRPTTSGRTLDVSAGGEAGVDWANVGSQSTSVNLSSTTTNLVNTATVATTATNLTNAPTAGDLTATMKTSVTTAATAATPTAAAVTGAVGSVTGNVGGNVVGSVASVTGNVGGLVVGTVTGVTPATAAQVAAILTTAVAESYRSNGAAPTLAQFMCEVLAHLGEAAISGTTKTINGLDHVTPAETFTLDSATDPATITRAT